MHKLFLQCVNGLFMLARMREFPIIEKLGGRNSAFAKLKAAGYRRSADAMRMWWAPGRGIIPGDATVLLMEIADAEGVGYGAEDFKLPDEARESAGQGGALAEAS